MQHWGYTPNYTGVSDTDALETARADAKAYEQQWGGVSPSKPKKPTDFIKTWTDLHGPLTS